MELNESKLIENEITLRSMVLPKEVKETKRSLIRWLGLAIGVINPKESRLSALSVIDALIYFHFKLKKNPTVSEMSEYIEKAWEPINEKTLRYHLLQLTKQNLIRHEKGKYYLMSSEEEGFDEAKWIENYFSTNIDPIKEKIIEALKELKNKN
ncbi:MAG: hypothetical protein ACP5UN_03355 [Candidatus Micrarchaeia archaeon]